MSSYLEHFGTNELMLLANDIRRDYNKTRERLKKKVEYYSRQSIASNYQKEEDIEAILAQCVELRRQYLDIRDVLIERGITQDAGGGWRESNNMLFPTNDILHSA